MVNLRFVWTYDMIFPMVHPEDIKIWLLGNEIISLKMVRFGQAWNMPVPETATVVFSVAS